MRDLLWPGYLNARDLGGIPTPLSPTGATIVGRVARGPRRERLTTEGWSAARDWGLSTLVDLRCAYEAGSRDGDPVIDADALDGIAVFSAPTEDQENEEFRAVCFPILDSPEYWTHNWRIVPDLVRDALRAIAHAEPGVLVHCSAGRDRTGMISTLLLGNAGVDLALVADDYAQSVRAMAGAQSHAPTHDRQATWTPEQVTAFLDEVTPIVQDAAATAERTLQTLGLTSDERARLRALLTKA